MWYSFTRLCLPSSSIPSLSSSESSSSFMPSMSESKYFFLIASEIVLNRSRLREFVKKNKKYIFFLARSGKIWESWWFNWHLPSIESRWSAPFWKQKIFPMSVLLAKYTRVRVRWGEQINCHAASFHSHWTDLPQRKPSPDLTPSFVGRYPLSISLCC